MNPDQLVVRAVRNVHVLGALSWPASEETRFLEAYARGERVLPRPPAVEIDTRADEALVQAIAAADAGDPLERLVIRTAEGYRQVLAMLTTAGTPDFVRHSGALFGVPSDEAVPGGPSILEEADQLLRTTSALLVESPKETLTDVEARDLLQAGIDPHFSDPLPVVLDPELGSLAAAGWKRVRLRGGIRYAPEQIEQLLQHEALVHSATKRNGRAQTELGCLGLSSPRTLAVQEGLATLAEMITDSLDLHRLRRIALRVRHVQAALDGADFIEVFEALLETGQPEQEAFRSSMRVFRGGDVRGGVAFTKDIVYLKGLRRVHSFLLSALRAQRDELPRVLFAGRMTCGDAVELAPFLGSRLKEPEVLPHWVKRHSHLAAYLAWAAFGQKIDELDLSAFTS